MTKPQKIKRDWSGMLTVDNIESVAQRICHLLEGKTYCFVSSNEGNGFLPDVRVNQTLQSCKGGSPFYVHHHEQGSFFGFCDTYGNWGCGTNLKGRGEGRLDPEFQNPHISMVNGVIKIRQTAAMGDKVFWVIAPQEASS